MASAIQAHASSRASSARLVVTASQNLGNVAKRPSAGCMSTAVLLTLEADPSRSHSGERRLRQEVVVLADVIVGIVWMGSED